VNGFIEETMDIFDEMCKDQMEEELPIIMETIFNLYIPLLKILAPDKGEHNSLYKRITMAIYK
jgi:hypothetical protein